MKRGSLEGSAITTGVNVTSITGGTIHGGVHTGPTTINHIHRGRRSTRPTEYPAGSIGGSLVKRNYVRYLVERYHRFRQADSSFGSGPARFSYAVIFKSIEREFRAPTYFIPEGRFGELVAYLQRRIDRTILGKRNRARGICNYVSPEEFAQMSTGKHYLVERTDDGRYAVRAKGSRRASDILDTQRQAIERVGELNPDDHPDVERVRNTEVGRRDKWRSSGR